MPRATVRDKVAALSPQQRRRITKMIPEGRTMVEIANRHKLDYVVVQALLWEQGTLSLRGSKSIITRRLGALKRATRQERRAELVEDIRQQVDYLYYAAKELQKKLVRVKKTVA